jgi:prolyl oligopeptidase
LIGKSPACAAIPKRNGTNNNSNGRNGVILMHRTQKISGSLGMKQGVIHYNLIGAALTTALALTSCGHAPAPDRSQASVLQYPVAPRGSQVDQYGSVSVADPYRWFEDLDSAQTKAWVTAENSLSQPYLEAISTRSWIKQRLTELWNYERYNIPVQEGGRYFWLRNNGLQNQSVLFVAEGLHAEPRVLLDPNALSTDATVALADFQVSPDGRYLAYALSDGGTDWKTWHVRDVTTGQDLTDVLKFAKFTQVSWERDSSAFFYSRYPLRADGTGDDSKQISVYRHKIGESQSQDLFIYSVTDHPSRNPYGQVTEDGKYLLINLFDGYETNGVYYAPLPVQPSADGIAVVRLLDDWRGLYTFLGSEGSVFYFLVTADSPNGRVVAIDTRRPTPKMWREVVAEANLSARCTLAGESVRCRRKDGQRGVAARTGDRRWTPGSRRQVRDVLLLCGLPDSELGLSLRRRHQSGGAV